MKTFKEWFDGLSDEAKVYIHMQVSNHNDLYDFSSPTYYNERYADPRQLLFEIEKYIKDHKTSDEDDDEIYARSDTCYKLFSYLLRMVNELNFAEDERTILNNAFRMLDKRDIVSYLANNDRKKYYRKDRNGYKADFYELLFVTEDFDNIDWEMLCYNTYHPVHQEILGVDECIRRAIATPQYLTGLMHNPSYVHKPDIVFDTMFFTEDGWTEPVKQNFLRQLNVDKTVFENLCYRVFSVDASYIKYILDQFANDWTTCNSVISQKKDENQTTRAKDCDYKYAKSLRELIAAVYACKKGKASKLTLSKLGDLAGILKLYDFRVNDIIDVAIGTLQENMVSVKNNLAVEQVAGE